MRTIDDLYDLKEAVDYVSGLFSKEADEALGLIGGVIEDIDALHEFTDDDTVKDRLLNIRSSLEKIQYNIGSIDSIANA